MKLRQKQRDASQRPLALNENLLIKITGAQKH